MHANEDRLLMVSARIALEGEMIGDFDKLLHTKLDWDYLWLTACRHRIASLVFHHIKKAKSHDFVPAEIMKKLEANYNAMAYRNLLIRKELVSILKAFEEKKIEVLLLKGWALIGTVYKNLALRPMSDIDLLVKKETIPDVRICMASLGFSQNLKLEGIPAIDDHHLTFYSSDGQSAPIEVHWNIGMDSRLFPIDGEAMIKRASMMVFEGVKARILSPEDSLLHLCFHLIYHHHGRLGLLGLCDISESIKLHQGDLDWAAMVKNAKAYRIAPHVYIALSLAQRAQGVEIPDALMVSLQAECSHAQLQWLEKLRENTLIVPPIKWETPLARLIWVKGLKNKGRFLFKAFFPSWSDVVFCLPPPLSFKKNILSYMIYPLLRLKKYWKSSFQYFLKVATRQTGRLLKRYKLVP